MHLNVFLNSSSIQLNVNVIENAIILPLKDTKKAIRIIFPTKVACAIKRVTLSQGLLILQKRFSCNKTYDFDYDTVIKSEEKVIFGRVFYHHFGVMLLLSLARFWWIIENRKPSYKIAFLLEPGNSSNAKIHLEKVMDLLRIPTEQYMIVDAPTEFSTVLIPDETLISVEKAVNIKYMEIYKYLRDSIISEYGYCDVKKLYLSRSRYIKFNNKCDGINEEYYENFYEKRGFTILHPEDMPLADQIRYIASADEIVSTYGTLSHMESLFSKENSSQTMLLRTQYMDNWFPIQAAILNMKKTIGLSLMRQKIRTLRCVMPVLSYIARQSTSSPFLKTLQWNMMNLNWR